ncbi:thyroid transcription factor 1-associated protein 26 [Peromyscus californicus insignis]|uniref:thyroid transcription factor 1-associated protein 26 n=1 Tax=Peromyscus californicus insignis TaxID=564181 RepID=UPI0022A7D311|nr:thyroid transcription factor 1-associated protein 26 [Peromyscus californicus insignis]
MAPARPAARWRSGGGFASRGDGTPPGGFRNQSGKRRTWRPSHQQAFRGSVREGQGFAFRRKLKIQQNYKKLLWKVKKAPVSQESQFTDHYPDHLKHLYLAEEERLRKQQRKVGPPPSEDQVDQPLPEEECNPEQTLSEDPSSDRQPQPEQLYTVNSDTIPKKKKKKTSNQKAQEEYERVQAKRAAKKFEFEMRKQEREEAHRLYKKKKMEAFKILSKKTKKGQPNLNLQMEYLLQKIQENS